MQKKSIIHDVNRKWPVNISESEEKKELELQNP